MITMVQIGYQTSGSDSTVVAERIRFDCVCRCCGLKSTVYDFTAAGGGREGQFDRVPGRGSNKGVYL